MGNLQSWRKYIEHVGLLGNTVNSSTRSIVAQGWPGRLFAFTLLHEPFHGLHARIGLREHGSASGPAAVTAPPPSLGTSEPAWPR